MSDADSDRRDAAARRLAGLSVRWLGAITDRVDAWEASRPETRVVARRLRACRRHGGADGEQGANVQSGVLGMLHEHRDTAAVAVAEARLLLHDAARLLERRVEVRRAGLITARILSMDDGAWGPEAQGLLQRVGPALLPAALELHASKDPALRGWGRTVVGRLDAGSPGAAVELDDPHLVAEVLRAFARGLWFEAMPTVTRFVDSDRSRVRAASREALERFGKDAVWQMREAYEDVTGKQATRSWGWRRTMHELYAAVDEQRTRELRPLLDQGLQAYAEGELDVMQERFDEVLKRAPQMPGSERMAVGYAALAARHLEQGEAGDAARLYRRALRLNGGHENAPDWKAQLALADAERQLEAGLADLAAFDRVPAAARVPARQTADSLRGRAAGSAHERRKWAAGAAAILLMGVGIVLIQRKRPAPKP